MKKLIMLLLCFLSAYSWAGKIYSSTKIAHSKTACPQKIVAMHMKKSSTINFCEYIKSQDEAYALILINNKEAGLILNLYKIVNGKQQLAHTVEGLGYHLVHFNSKNVFIANDFNKDGKVEVLLRVASSPQEMVLGFSVNTKSGKLDDAISRKIDLGENDFIYEDSLTVLPVDTLGTNAKSLKVWSKKYGTSTYTFKNGKFRN